MKETVFRIGAVILFGIIIFATVFTAVSQNGGHTDAMADVNGEPIIKTGKIYYNKLTRKQQCIYEAVEKAAGELEMLTEKIPFTAEMADVGAAIGALLSDSPEYFYIDAESFSLEDYSYTETNSDGESREISGQTLIDGKYTQLKMCYFGTLEEIKTKRTRLDAAISKSNSLISSLEDDLDKQTAIHDYIIGVCEKAEGQTGLDVSNAYGALVEGMADSEGYHRAFKLLLNKAGIISHLTYGEVRGVPSVWCTVLINDKYYNTDLCEDDLGTQYGEKALHGVITHAYMNVSDEAIASTHTGKSDVVPKCTDSDTYYYLKGLISTNAAMSEKIIDAQLENFVRYKKQCIELYCSYTPVAKDIEDYVYRHFEFLYPEYSCTATLIHPKTEFDAYSVHIDYFLKSE